MTYSIVSRKQAHANGLTHYYTGKPCIHGHDSPRFVSTGGCVECQAQYTKKYHQKFKSAEAPPVPNAVRLAAQYVHPDCLDQILAMIDSLNAAYGLPPAFRPGPDVKYEPTPFQRFRATRHKDEPLWATVEQAARQVPPIPVTFAPGEEPAPEELQKPALRVPDHLKNGTGNHALYAPTLR